MKILLGGCSAEIAQWMLSERPAEFARRACSAMLGGISGVESFIIHALQLGWVKITR